MNNSINARMPGGRNKLPSAKPPINMDALFFTSAEARELLRMSNGAFWAKVKDGTIPAKRFGKKLLISGAWLREQAA